MAQSISMAQIHHQPRPVVNQALRLTRAAQEAEQAEQGQRPILASVCQAAAPAGVALDRPQALPAQAAPVLAVMVALAEVGAAPAA
jgi:hypothetical protein